MYAKCQQQFLQKSELILQSIFLKNFIENIRFLDTQIHIYDEKGQSCCNGRVDGKYVVIYLSCPLICGKIYTNNNQYQSMLSESLPQATPSLLFTHHLTPQLIQELKTQKVQAQSTLFLKKMPKPTSCSEQAGQMIILQIIDDYIVQRCPETAQILSAFKCDYEIVFQTIRKMSHIPHKLGQADGLRFIFREKENLKVELGVSKQKTRQLQIFCDILAQKYIVQYGFHNSFKAIKKIGKGMTACVYNAINFADGKEVAIKSFKRSVYFAQDNNNGKKSFCKEFKILSQCNHKNICKMQSVYETENSTYIILELYPMSLYGFLQKFGFPQEQAVKGIMTNLLEGIAYLHSKGVMHRDLKLQNIMVKKNGTTRGSVIPVIVDLGLAEYISATKYLYTRCGTPGYVAPEVLKIKSSDPIQTYNCVCDVFSLGVIFHILMFKKPLFQGKDPKEVIKKNCQCQINFQSEMFATISADGRDLFRKMLDSNPLQRISAQQALSHPYLASENIESCTQNLQAQHILPTDIDITNQPEA